MKWKWLTRARGSYVLSGANGTVPRPEWFEQDPDLERFLREHGWKP